MPDRGRERERKRRRRRSFDEDDNGFSGWKLGLVVGVIVVCFAMLYPTVLHPMLMSFFGRSEPAKAPRPSRPPVHPGMGGPGGGRTGGRHDVHPAMKMAQQQAESHSSGRGMFTWMLPLYTIGVVIFLLYTLFKSKNRRKRRSRYDSSEFSSDEDEYNDRLTKRLGKKKLRGLQERLQQTEEAMTKILEQLEAVQAAGALIEGEQGLKGRKDDPEKSELLPQVDAKNEQYINDLEKALKDFKVLSEAYEEEKSMIRRKSRSEEDETSSEELHSESSEDVEEPEEKTKEQTKIELVDESEEEYFSKENETKSLIDKECVENESAKPIAKNVRRRAKKL